MTRNTELDTVATEYLAALDSGDFDKLAELWKEAETRADFAQLFHTLNAASLKDEEGNTEHAD